MPFIKAQTCQILMEVIQEERPEDSDMQGFIGKSFCN
jgi:hypothetical protein